MSEAIANRRRAERRIHPGKLLSTIKDTRSGKERREVSDATFGTGPELTEEEIERAEKMRFCSTCGIYHEGRDCQHQSAQPCGCDAGAGWTCEEHRSQE